MGSNKHGQLASHLTILDQYYNMKQITNTGELLISLRHFLSLSLTYFNENHCKSDNHDTKLKDIGPDDRSHPTLQYTYSTYYSPVINIGLPVMV